MPPIREPIFSSVINHSKNRYPSVFIHTFLPAAHRAITNTTTITIRYWGLVFIIVKVDK